MNVCWLLLLTTAPLAAAAPLTRLLSTFNAYPSEFDLGASFSVLRETNLVSGADSKLALTFRLGSHITTPWIRISSEDATLRAFDDGDSFLQLDASGSHPHYKPFKSSKVGKDAAKAAAEMTLFVDNAIVADVAEKKSAAERFWAMDLRFNVHAMSARNGTVVSRGVGRVDTFPNDVCGVAYATWLPRDAKAAAGGAGSTDQNGMPAEMLFLARNRCSHKGPASLWGFDPRANATTLLFTEDESASDLTGSSMYFCAVTSRPSTRQVFALIERHNSTNFPDQDCQNLSGLVDSFEVVELPYRHTGGNGGISSSSTTTSSKGGGIVRTVAKFPAYSGMRSGGPMDDEAGVWHFVNAGKVESVDVSAGAVNGKPKFSFQGDILGDNPVLVPLVH